MPRAFNTSCGVAFAHGFGATASRPCRGMKVDLALLDVSLGSETVFPVSKLLEGMRIPFIFVTGNPTLLPAEYSRRPLVPKPWQRHALLALIPQVIRGHSAG